MSSASEHQEAAVAAVARDLIASIRSVHNLIEMTDDAALLCDMLKLVGDLEQRLVQLNGLQQAHVLD